jgi:hypothetical protein
MKPIKYFLILMLTLAFLSLCPNARANEKDNPPPLPNTQKSTHPGQGPAVRLIAFFQKNISPVDGSRCPSQPSCSSYSLQAFQKHGFVKGWLMTVDRLIHEGSEETKVSPVVLIDGQYKILDPVENNDFWWYP